jgi:ATP-dependent DNA ligase
VAALKDLKAKQFVLDGEIIITVDGEPSFDELLQRIHPAASRVKMLSETYPCTFIVFDLLMNEEGLALVEQPLERRRRELERFAKKFVRGERIVLSPATRDFDEAKRWFQQMRGSLDGVIAKPLDLPYESGNREGMQKIKNRRTAGS